MEADGKGSVHACTLGIKCSGQSLTLKHPIGTSQRTIHFELVRRATVTNLSSLSAYPADNLLFSFDGTYLASYRLRANRQGQEVPTMIACVCGFTTETESELISHFSECHQLSYGSEVCTRGTGQMDTPETAPHPVAAVEETHDQGQESH
jgi:hypothetical protein